MKPGSVQIGRYPLTTPTAEGSGIAQETVESDLRENPETTVNSKNESLGAPVTITEPKSAEIDAVFAVDEQSPHAMHRGLQFLMAGAAGVVFVKQRAIDDDVEGRAGQNRQAFRA